LCCSDSFDISPVTSSYWSVHVPRGRLIAHVPAMSKYLPIFHVSRLLSDTDHLLWSTVIVCNFNFVPNTLCIVNQLYIFFHRLYI
jgi:hypothetical protein